MEVIMLLTGCVTPNVTDKLNYAAQPEERKRQYVDAIRWYLDHTPYKLVFAENSGCDLSPLFEDYKDRTEFLTYKDTTISNRSKGYKEMEILEYVRDTSRFIGGGKNQIVIKITGRLKLLNIVELTGYVEKKAERCKVGFVSALKNIRRRDADCKYIWFSANWFPYLLAQKEKIYFHYPFEMITADAILEAKHDRFKFFYPRHQMREEGRGTKGGSYDMTDEQYLKADRKHQMKRLLFDLGIFPLNFRK